MIRLGSLAGYPFDGPRVLAGWAPPAVPAVYAILYRPAPRRAQCAVFYVGASAPRTTAGLPVRQPAAPCWVERAGGRFGVHVATYEIPGGLPGHRAQLAEELVSIYRPQCNDQQFDATWREEWIGSYRAPTTGPLTTRRSPAGGGSSTES